MEHSEVNLFITMLVVLYVLVLVDNVYLIVCAHFFFYFYI